MLQTRDKTFHKYDNRNLSDSYNTNVEKSGNIGSLKILGVSTPNYTMLVNLVCRLFRTRTFSSYSRYSSALQVHLKRILRQLRSELRKMPRNFQSIWMYSSYTTHILTVEAKIKKSSALSLCAIVIFVKIRPKTLSIDRMRKKMVHILTSEWRSSSVTRSRFLW